MPLLIVLPVPPPLEASLNQRLNSDQDLCRFKFAPYRMFFALGPNQTVWVDDLVLVKWR